MHVSGKKHNVLVTMLNFTYSGKKATLNGAQSTEFVASTVIANFLIKKLAQFPIQISLQYCRDNVLFTCSLEFRVLHILH